jgi:hypothetical protein
MRCRDTCFRHDIALRRQHGGVLAERPSALPPSLGTSLGAFQIEMAFLIFLATPTPTRLIAADFALHSDGSATAV